MFVSGIKYFRFMLILLHALCVFDYFVLFIFLICFSSLRMHRRRKKLRNNLHTYIKKSFFRSLDIAYIYLYVEN